MRQSCYKSVIRGFANTWAGSVSVGLVREGYLAGVLPSILLGFRVARLVDHLVQAVFLATAGQCPCCCLIGYLVYMFGSTGDPQRDGFVLAKIVLALRWIR